MTAPTRGITSTSKLCRLETLATAQGIVSTLLMLLESATKEPGAAVSLAYIADAQMAAAKCEHAIDRAIDEEEKRGAAARVDKSNYAVSDMRTEVPE